MITIIPASGCGVHKTVERDEKNRDSDPLMSLLPPGLGTTTQDESPDVTTDIKSQDSKNYGMSGLLSFLKMEQNDHNMFAIGSDVINYGLDLLEDSQVLKNLALPWVETLRLEVEPYFSLPSSIQPDNIIPPPGPCDLKIQSFSDETLFYIFYMKPRDTLQEYAARELVLRNWRYHKDIQVWLTKDSQVEPVLISPDVERGVYIFFDPHNWTKIKKEFVLHYSLVQA